MNTRMSITLDNNLIDEVRKLFSGATKAEAIRLALEHAVRHGQLKKTLHHAGELDIDLDQEALAAHRSES